jgi:hypothetical protein
LEQEEPASSRANSRKYAVFFKGLKGMDKGLILWITVYI